MKNRELVPATFQSPFTLMRRLSDEMERMFEDFNIRRPFSLLAPEVRTFEWAPANGCRGWPSVRPGAVRGSFPGPSHQRSGVRGLLGNSGWG